MGPNATTPEQEEEYIPLDEDNSLTSTISHLVNMDFHAVWSVRGINGISPTPRFGHCSGYSQEHDFAVIGYGAQQDKTPLDDFWVLDFINQSWRRLLINQAPRAGARGALLGFNYWIFGGFSNRKYMSDLHVINVKTGEVARPVTNGHEPCPRSGHSFGYINNNLVLYGGYNGSILQDACILDLETMTWSHVDTGTPRCRATFAIGNDRMLVYGASNSPGVTVINENGHLDLVQCSGTFPPSGTTRASFVNIGRGLFVFIGGQPPQGKEGGNPDSHMLIYCLDTNQKIWGTIPIIPDGRTVSVFDGVVDEQMGLFKLPRCFDSSIFWREKVRELVVILGEPMNSPPVQYVMSLGQTLPKMALMKDMYDMYHGQS